MAVHWNAAGDADRTTTKLIAILLMPAVVVGMSVLFEVTNVDDNDRVVGSVAMLLLLVVQIMVFLINLGINVPIVSVALAGAFVVVGLAVWYEVRDPR
jgi:heme A synthase